MKIALILASSIPETPYLKYYTSILAKCQVEYDVICWDKKGEMLGNEAKYIYSKRSDNFGNVFNKTLNLIGFILFAKKTVRDNTYDKIVVFAIGTSFMLAYYLCRQYKNKYIFDIRDHSRILNNFIGRIVIKQLIKNSYITSVSSEGFLSWLPPFDKYILSHNIGNGIAINDDGHHSLIANDPFLILNIGFIRGYIPNKILIDAVANNIKYRLYFIGIGEVKDALENHVVRSNIKNVKFEGSYIKSVEQNLISKCNMINILLDDTLNDNTCMTNRFYNAVVCQRPILVYDGSVQADLVAKYHLGLVIQRNMDICTDLEQYIASFDWEIYAKGCDAFLTKVQADMNSFHDMIIKFVSN